jgi:aerobic-type carbon monoxide dehydrogenase small subunit (CoxS/CutS family)
MPLKVNGQTHTVDADPAIPLLYVLSDDLRLRGPKFGCGLSQCGACTAIVDGNAVRTCVMPVSRASGGARRDRSLAAPFSRRIRRTHRRL